MVRQIPAPVSGGLILSYKCPAECRHCIYACSPGWDSGWISGEVLEEVLSQLAGRIIPAPRGPGSVGLNHGLHFTGGEPFANFDLLCRAVKTARELKIPSTFVETNCFWAVDEKTALEKLRLLKDLGLMGIMISVNPFYLEYVPFERTERAVKAGLDVFGENTMVYQFEYYKRFVRWEIRDKVTLDEYLGMEKKKDFLRNVEFFIMGRAPYRLRDILREYLPVRRAEHFFAEPCVTPFLRSLHNHFDNKGNYVPGFCAGITLGDCRMLDELLRNGVDIEEYPILGYLIDEDMEGLYEFAGEYGYRDSTEGYFSKCHLCTDIRRHLALNGDFRELEPREFYLHLE